MLVYVWRGSAMKFILLEEQVRELFTVVISYHVGCTCLHVAVRACM